MPVSVSIAKPVRRRLPYKENTVDGILCFGKDNLYPQRMGELIKRSGSGTASVRLFAKFLRGAGFTDEQLNDPDFKINTAGQTPRDLLREVCTSYSTNFGFAIHVDYNAFLQPINPKVIEWEYCRLGLPDSLGNITKIVVCSDWGREKAKTILKQRVDIFNSAPEIVMQQIERAGGLEHYKGQILYVTQEANKYPTCTFDEVAADVETDAQISTFRETSTASKFMADYFAEYPGEFTTDDERRKFNDSLVKFQGVENQGHIMLIENPHAPEKTIKFTKVDVQNNDKLFEWTDSSAQTKIRKNYTQPAILVGDLIPGRLGNTLEIENSVNFYNMFTYDDRDKIAAALKKVLKLNPALTAVESWDIQPLTWQMFLQSMGIATPAANGDPQAQAGVKLSVGDFAKVLNMVKKFKDGKINEAELNVFCKGYGLGDNDIQQLIADAEDGVIDGQ